jgi:hypothetical protein
MTTSKLEEYEGKLRKLERKLEKRHALRESLLDEVVILNNAITVLRVQIQEMKELLK